MSDDELMIRIQGGDDAAFAELVGRYEGALLGFFIRNARDRQLAEDLTQETLLKVFNQAWDYLPLGRFRAWMFRIARNLLIDDLRRRSHDALVRAVHARRSDDDDTLARLAGDFVSPADAVDSGELAALIDQVLDEIPTDQRLTFTLHHHEDLSLPEVADIMEVPLATCKSRLRLAREKLSEKLRSRGFHPPQREERP
jgi:RNA polymerase sigma-70 factor (ECF subfamily)